MLISWMGVKQDFHASISCWVAYCWCLQSQTWSTVVNFEAWSSWGTSSFVSEMLHAEEDSPSECWSLNFHLDLQLEAFICLPVLSRAVIYALLKLFHCIKVLKECFGVVMVGFGTTAVMKVLQFLKEKCLSPKRISAKYSLLSLAYPV